MLPLQSTYWFRAGNKVAVKSQVTCEVLGHSCNMYSHINVALSTCKYIQKPLGLLMLVVDSVHSLPLLDVLLFPRSWCFDAVG